MRQLKAKDQLKYIQYRVTLVLKEHFTL